MAYALEVRSLRKGYGSTEVLHGIDLAVPMGSVYGFVGLNGAGKTTTLTCALGLERRSSGEVRVTDRVSAVFDTPGLHPNLTVQQELELGYRLCHREGRSPEQVSEWLGLTPNLRKRTSRLSLGNRRRTSIALALLGAPELVILDEPFVGLDARGVDDLLDLVARLREEGTTFLLSSHQLELVERCTTHLGCIHRGSVVASGTRENLLEGHGGLRVGVDNGDLARSVLRDQLGLASESSGDGIIVFHGDTEASAVNECLVGAGVRVSELRLEGGNLAALFRELTQEEAA